MIATSYTTPEFAVSHLRWCLNQPLLCGGRDWGACVYRALGRLGDAWERRIDYLEIDNGQLTQIADPGLLPFTLEARRVRELRGRHQRLREQIQVGRLQFRDALLLFSCDSEVPQDAIADARAYRLYGVLGSCAADVLSALEEYRVAEAALLGGPDDTQRTMGDNNSAAAYARPAERLRAPERAREVKSNYL